MKVDLTKTELGPKKERSGDSDSDGYDSKPQFSFKEKQEHPFQRLIKGIISRCHDQGFSAEEYYEIKKRGVLTKKEFLNRTSELW